MTLPLGLGGSQERGGFGDPDGQHDYLDRGRLRRWKLLRLNLMIILQLKCNILPWMTLLLGLGGGQERGGLGDPHGQHGHLDRGGPQAGPQ